MEENAGVGDGARHGTRAWRAGGREGRRRERLRSLGTFDVGSAMQCARVRWRCVAEGGSIDWADGLSAEVRDVDRAAGSPGRMAEIRTKYRGKNEEISFKAILTMRDSRLYKARVHLELYRPSETGGESAVPGDRAGAMSTRVSG